MDLIYKSLQCLVQPKTNKQTKQCLVLPFGNVHVYKNVQRQFPFAFDGRKTYYISTLDCNEMPQLSEIQRIEALIMLLRGDNVTYVAGCSGATGTSLLFLCY